MEKISICIPTWNRYDLTKKCFEQVLNDDRIAEILINDDNSIDGSYQKLVDDYLFDEKVVVKINNDRLKVHGNKHMAVYNSYIHKKTEWCILFDSDNVLTKDYLDKLYTLDWDKNTSYQPSFARPNFDYRHLVGVYDNNNISEKIDLPLFDCMLNTQNFFINKSEYVRVWRDEQDINGADSIFFNALWISAGNKIQVVDGLEYDHLVHRGSFYESVAEESLPKSNLIKEKLKNGIFN